MDSRLTMVIRVKDTTSSAITEIDDGPHGTSTHYIITKPRFFNFQNFLKTDRPTDRQTDRPTDIVTYKDDYPSPKKKE